MAKKTSATTADQGTTAAEISGRPGLEPIRWIAWLCNDLFHLQIRYF